MLSKRSESELCMRMLNNASKTSCKNFTTSSPSTFIKAFKLSRNLSGWLVQFNKPKRSTENSITNYV